ncbi:hypothetical protein CEXT_607071 [Caerostris extrusa]|uniref:Uncharacterized protein n=1 Tax=Caerostris extrusa TaxID=172846 RepID=A0AAV4VFZ2_CAEEX|nr:hypothetical protein CEXT_607071 [Caerostris extrusa]
MHWCSHSSRCSTGCLGECILRGGGDAREGARGHRSSFDCRYACATGGCGNRDAGHSPPRSSCSWMIPAPVDEKMVRG